MVDMTDRISRDPRFIELVRRRGSYSWTLCAIMFVIYLGFIFLVALRHDITGIVIGGGITLAFPLALFVILTAIVLTAMYVSRANASYDQLAAEIAADVR